MDLTAGPKCSREPPVGSSVEGAGPAITGGQFADSQSADRPTHTTRAAPRAVGSDGQYRGICGRRDAAGRRTSAGLGSGPSQVSVSGAMSTSPGHTTVPSWARTRRKMAPSAAIGSNTGPSRRSVRSRTTTDPSVRVSRTDRPGSGVTARTRSTTRAFYRRGSILQPPRISESKVRAADIRGVAVLAHGPTRLLVPVARDDVTNTGRPPTVRTPAAENLTSKVA